MGPSLCPTIGNPDLVLQEKGSSPTHSHFNHVPSGDTLRRDAMTSFRDRLLNGLCKYYWLDLPEKKTSKFLVQLRFH